MSATSNKNYTKDDTAINEIILALNSIKFGCLQIKVHNSKVVQIEKTEKIRFIDTHEKGGGI